MPLTAPAGARRRGARLLASLAAAALVLTGVGAAASAAQAAPIRNAMSGTVTFAPGFVPDRTEDPGLPVETTFGVLMAFDLADGAPSADNQAAPRGIGVFLPDYQPKTRTVTFGVIDQIFGGAMESGHEYGLIYYTQAEYRKLAQEAQESEGAPANLRYLYVSADGTRTEKFSQAGRFRLGQSNIRINLDPRVTGKKPSLRGTAAVGKRLTATTSGWGPTGVKLSYQWLRNGKTISGATKSSYQLRKADRATKISIRVTGKKTGYRTLALTSSAKKVPATASRTRR